MTDTNQDRKRTNRRITYAATAIGVEKAEQALKEKRFASKKDFADLCGLSRSTITNFFGRKSIELEGFQKICDELGLSNWKEIADIENSDTGEKLKTEPNSYHQTINDKDEIPFSFAGSVKEKDIPKLKNLLKLIQKLANDDFIEVVEVEEGSIKLTLKGSPAGLKRLEQLFQSGELNQIFEQEFNITFEDVRFINTQNLDGDIKNKTTTTEETQLAFTIAGDVNQADIDILKAALINMFEKVKATCMSYLGAFSTLKAANVSGYFHLPAVIMTKDQVAFMNSIDDVEAVFRALFRYSEANNFKHRTLDSMQIKIVSENQAIVVGVATHYRQDESVLEHFGFTYTLRKTDESFTINNVEHNWKIITGVFHDALDFSVVQSYKLP